MKRYECKFVLIKVKKFNFAHGRIELFYVVKMDKKRRHFRKTGSRGIWGGGWGVGGGLTNYFNLVEYV
jgi:hypothetical protein